MTSGAPASSTVAAAEPLSATLPVNGFDLHYWEWPGSEPTLVCLHPSGHYGRIWERVAQQLAPRFHVLAPDQRGHGDSSQPPDGNAAEDYAADVEALAAARGLDQIVLVGHSLGARTAMVHAAQHPERVSRMILVGGPHYSTIDPGADVDHWTGNSNAMRQRSRQVASAEEAAASLRASYPKFTEADIQHALKYNTQPSTSVSGGLEWKFEPSWVANGLMHALDDLRPYAAQIRCPILILRATSSWELTPERMSTVTGVFRNAQVTVVEVDASANLEVEAPDAVATAIRDYLTN
ncbi:MAG: alpha/beta hydrolase [Chloroflexi bacterium]|nr:alpha/beta hydrolase [Chloroflexota bacterium]